MLSDSVEPFDKLTVKHVVMDSVEPLVILTVEHVVMDIFSTMLTHCHTFH